MNPSLPLLSIIAYARAGALDHAWRMFEGLGLDMAEDDPDVLSVRGRLLKDRALGAVGEERRALLEQSAQAYAAAGAISGASYPLINAASLSLMAGKAEQAHRLARQVLDLAGSADAQPDTPYYQAATPAEALLVLGRADDARAALAQAIALAPRAWEDHASTLRQFGMVLQATGQAVGWLDALRPPRCLHFAGQMAIAPDAQARLAAEAAAFIGTENVGFGFGALAAGSDLLMAEALLQAGAELHVVLPAAAQVFRRMSVQPFGAQAAQRFDALLAKADTVRILDEDATAVSPLSVQLAAEVAMGAAVARARMLQTEAVQLLILSEQDALGQSTIQNGRLWSRGGRRRQVLGAPPSASGSAPSAGELQPSCQRLAVLLALELAADPLASDLAVRITQALSPIGPPDYHQWTATGLLLALDDLDLAVASAKAILQAAAAHDEARVGLHYDLVTPRADPLGSDLQLSGHSLALTRRIASAAPPSLVYASENFVAALEVRSGDAPPVQYVGDLESGAAEAPVRLYALRA